MTRILIAPLLLFLALGAVACGAGETAPSSDAAPAAAPVDPAVAAGPVASVDLGPVDEALVVEGKTLFETRCTPCHRGAERYVGPALNGVTERRSPVYVMNMILNPEGMLRSHPDVQKLFSEYGVPMTNQNLTEAQARAILEYLRDVDRGLPND